MAYGMVLGQTPKSPKANEVEYSNASTSALITSNNVQGAIDQLFTSVSNGKNKIAGAITDKGVSTSGTDSFDVMAGNIGKISTTPKVSMESYTLDRAGECNIRPGYILWQTCFVVIDYYEFSYQTVAAHVNFYGNVREYKNTISLKGNQLTVPPQSRTTGDGSKVKMTPIEVYIYII